MTCIESFELKLAKDQERESYYKTLSHLNKVVSLLFMETVFMLRVDQKRVTEVFRGDAVLFSPEKVHRFGELGNAICSLTGDGPVPFDDPEVVLGQTEDGSFEITAKSYYPSKKCLAPGSKPNGGCTGCSFLGEVAIEIKG